MTKVKAKKLTLELWRYLRDNPHIKEKHKVPKKLYDKIRECEDLCPLCEYFDDIVNCHVCPLGPNCFGNREPYGNWCESKQNKTRKKYAAEIVKLVEKW